MTFSNSLESKFRKNSFKINRVILVNRRCGHLFPMNDSEAGLDIRKSVGCGEYGLAFVLFLQLPMCPAVLCEWGGVHKPICKSEVLH